MEKHDMDFAKVLAVLSQPKVIPAPLTGVTVKRLDVRYMSRKNGVQTRPLRLYVPEKTELPVPLVFIAHYEMPEDSLELRAYLAKGYAVASATEFKDEYNGQLMNDDLMFNNAAYNILRELPEIDRRRIAVIGGSAGGYMTLMLNALQTGICCSIANSPIANIYFNFYYTAPMINKCNLAAMAEMESIISKPFAEMSITERNELLTRLPAPLIAMVGSSFANGSQENAGQPSMAELEDLSPVAFTECFGNPLMINHFTSDLLVPVDQITKRFTYEKPGKSLPAELSLLLRGINGKLGMSLEERLPEAETRVQLFPAELTEKEGFAYPFDTDKRFSLNIYDEGPVEGYAGHRIVSAPENPSDDTVFLETMFARTSKQTNILSTEKLRLLLDRYSGRSTHLPVIADAPEDVYGSRASYRREVCKQLADWQTDNGRASLDNVAQALLEQCTGSERELYAAAINDVLERIPGCHMMHNEC